MPQSYDVPRALATVDGSYPADVDGFRQSATWYGAIEGYVLATEVPDDCSLVVLGEPGVGKSTTIRQIVAHRDAAWVPLDEADSAPALTDLLQSAAASVANRPTPTVVVDGLDESPLPAKTLSRRLRQFLEGTPVGVVIGSRSSSWSNELSTMLSEVRADIRTYELLPLSIDDIRTAAQTNGLSSEDFERAVRDVGAAALAMRPLTLNVLLDVFATSGRLPAEPTVLFAKGLEHLADEHDKARPQGEWSIEHRLAVAERIAASLLVAGAATVTTDPPSGSELSWGALSAGRERIVSGEFDVTPDLLLETLRTGLFQGRGPSRFAPSHATFAAFLAARYLIRRRLTEDQFRSLLTRSHRVARPGLPGHLRETAAWLVSMAPGRFGWLVDIDAEGLLAHAAYIRDHRSRELLVDRLLNDGELAISARAIRWRLAHPGLADQLEPALTAPLTEGAGDDFGNPISRAAGTAIDIARASRTTEVIPKLATLAVSAELNSYLRYRAAKALLNLDPDLAATALRPILDEVQTKPEHDPNDDLRGVALNACHRDLTGAELSDLLSRPKPNDYVGEYAFVLHEIGNKLTLTQITSLVAAAKAAEEQAHREQTGEEVRGEGTTAGAAVYELLQRREGSGLANELTLRLLAGGTDNDIGTDVLPHAAWLVARTLQSGGSAVLPTRMLQPAGPPVAQTPDALDRRRLGVAVAQALPVKMRMLIGRVVRAPRLGFHDAGELSRPLLGADDFEWLLTSDLGVDPDVRWILTRSTYDPEDPAHVQLAWDHRRDCDLDWITHWFDAMAIDSDEAKRWREMYENAPETWADQGALAAELRQAWVAVTEGDSMSAARVVSLLRYDPSSGLYNTFPTEDMATWPGLRASGIDPGELAEACRGYLQTATPPPSDEWLWRTNLLHDGAIDLYVMLRLLAETRPTSEVRAQLPDHVWETLAPVVIRSHRVPYVEDDSPAAALIRVVRGANTDLFRDGYLERIQQCLAQGDDSLPPLWPLEDVYNTGIETTLTQAAQTLADRFSDVEADIAKSGPEPKSGTREARDLSGLRQRLQNLSRSLSDILDLAFTSSTAADRLRPLTDKDQSNQVRALTGIRLFLHGHVTWTELWGSVAVDDAMTRSLVDALARAVQLSHGQHLLNDLAENDLVILWEWIERSLPAGSGHAPGFIGSPERLRRLQEDILAHLAQRTTEGALNALATLEERHPEVYAIKMRRRAAEEIYLDGAWEGTHVEDFMRLVTDASFAVVHDAESLYRVVKRAIDALPDRLRQEGMGDLLWNESLPPTGSPAKTPALYRPANEAQIQAIVADQLRSELGRGLVVNREVQVRTTTSKGHGLAVDVLVSGGNPSDGRPSPSCPIEVKGNWNPKLLTDLRDQLVDDYMRDLNATFGFYVCGWFDQDLWTDTSDRRKAQAAKHGITTATDELTQAAATAKRDHGVHVEVAIVRIPRSVPSKRSA